MVQAPWLKAKHVCCAMGVDLDLVDFLEEEVEDEEGVLTIGKAYR